MTFSVKPLKWPDEIKRGQRVMSGHGLVQYTICHYGGSAPDSGTVYRWAASGEGWHGPFFSYEDAIAAAEADYRNRIMSALLPKATAPAIETRNDEAGFIEFLNDDVPTVTREIDGPCAILLDLNTRQVVGYRVYDPATAPVVSERREIETEAETLQRLADGDRIVYSLDGETAWFHNGDRAFVSDDVMVDLHLSGFIETVNEGQDEDWHEWGQITDKGRAALEAFVKGE